MKLDVILESIKTDSNISAIRAQGWFALRIIYWSWVAFNSVQLLSYSIVYVQSSGTKGGDFQLYGWIEIIALTTALIVGKVAQSFSKGDQNTKTEGA